MSNPTQTVRLKVSPEVARIVTPGAPRELKLEAARGELPLAGKDLVPALFFLSHSGDAEIKALALTTFRRLTPVVLHAVLENVELHPQLLDFIAAHHQNEPAVVVPLLDHPALAEVTLLRLAQQGSGEILALLGRSERCRHSPAVAAALRANPAAGEEKAESPPESAGDTETADEGEPPAEEPDDASWDEEELAEEELNFSKYQMAMEMGVSEKIKMALTGDKEWRSIFLKDPNKLVSSAVLKNPRITDGEVLAVAKNKSANEELIRLITLNREWIKHYEIKKALVLHPRTPLPKALRYMNVLSEKDIKSLAKSRGVSQVIVNNARRMVMAKEKKG